MGMRAAGVLLATVLTLTLISCGVPSKQVAGPSSEEMLASREAYETAFFRLDAAEEAAEQALDDAYDCMEADCREPTVRAAEQALRAEDEAYLAFSRAMDERWRIADSLAEVGTNECRACASYADAARAHIAAERMYRQARRFEYGLYVEWLRCDTDACWDAVDESLNVEAVPRRAAAAVRLDAAIQTMLEAEDALYQELGG